MWATVTSTRLPGARDRSGACWESRSICSVPSGVPGSLVGVLVLGPIPRWESLKILRQTVKTGMSTKRGIRPWMWVLALSMTAVGVVGYLVGLAAISATSAPGWIAQSSVMVGLFGASFFAFLVANRRAPPLVAAILAAFVFIALVALFIVVVRTETVPN